MRTAILFVLLAAQAWADAGVLLPGDRPQPDPTILSLEEMAIDIWIDDGDARVLVRQIFASHNPGVLEGNYVFALPGRATVSDFAVWDGVTRIPGVILERRRAEEIYAEAKRQVIDPGLLQMGERNSDEARRTAVFSAKVVPIPAWGTKRVEIEYHERIPVENLESFFAVPLRPDAYHAQTAGHFWITLEVRSSLALRDFQITSKAYPLQVRERNAHFVRAGFEGRNVNLTEDFAMKYAFDGSRGAALEVLTYRNPEPSAPSPTDAAPAPVRQEPGFFQASMLLASGPVQGSATNGAPRTVLALFDTSLSMQWEKLERSYQALEALLRSLRAVDRFNLLLFNTEVTTFQPAPIAAEPPAVEKALDFVKASRLRGGTNLERALEAALGQAPGAGGESYLVLLGDGDPTRGVINNSKLGAWYAGKWKASGRPRTFVFAVGDDANMPLLRMLSRNDGLLEWVRSTEPIEFKLNAFISKIGRRPAEQLQLTAAPESNFDLIYPLEDVWFSGSVASWVGQYKKPAQPADFAVRGLVERRPIEARAAASLPEKNLDHPSLPRTWAQARVNALLDKIEREGEDRATVDEIIRLARKYKFVTPYTSFLAVPRALLRPRMIRPGDPVLRVKTDPSIASVTALFPFGAIQRLRYLKDEDTWQTRFVAPPEMADGAYRVRLILRDVQGHVYRESKAFTIASKPPVLRVDLNKKLVRRGEVVQVRARASETTRTVVARMYGAPPVRLRWNERAGSNTGDLAIPADLPAGRYILTVTAEDFAHNIGSQEVSIEVAP